MGIVDFLLIVIPSWLSEMDRELFLLIHRDGAIEKMDWLFKALRNALTWIPLYLFVLIWILQRQKRQSWKFVLLTLIVFAITDHTSASILKPFFQRLRPCFDASLQDHVRTLVTCGGQYGMPSTHASNHFGLAAFWFFSIGTISGRRWYWLWLWALAIGYAQIYVGKHYPGDILVGALLGTLTGILMWWVWKKWTDTYATVPPGKRRFS